MYFLSLGCSILESWSLNSSRSSDNGIRHLDSPPKTKRVRRSPDLMAELAKRSLIFFIAASCLEGETSVAGIENDSSKAITISRLPVEVTTLNPDIWGPDKEVII